jgi:hypothetical protein
MLEPLKWRLLYTQNQLQKAKQTTPVVRKGKWQMDGSVKRPAFLRQASLAQMKQERLVSAFLEMICEWFRLTNSKASLLELVRW